MQVNCVVIANKSRSHLGLLFVLLLVMMLERMKLPTKMMMWTMPMMMAMMMGTMMEMMVGTIMSLPLLMPSRTGRHHSHSLSSATDIVDVVVQLLDLLLLLLQSFLTKPWNYSNC